MSTEIVDEIESLVMKKFPPMREAIMDDNGHLVVALAMRVIQCRPTDKGIGHLYALLALMYYYGEGIDADTIKGINYAIMATRHKHPYGYALLIHHYYGPNNNNDDIQTIYNELELLPLSKLKTICIAHTTCIIMTAKNNLITPLTKQCNEQKSVITDLANNNSEQAK